MYSGTSGTILQGWLGIRSPNTLFMQRSAVKIFPICLQGILCLDPLKDSSTAHIGLSVRLSFKVPTALQDVTDLPLQLLRLVPGSTYLTLWIARLSVGPVSPVMGHWYSVTFRGIVQIKAKCSPNLTVKPVLWTFS